MVEAQRLRGRVAAATGGFWLVVVVLSVQRSAGEGTVVVSDGSFQKPFCSFARRCGWDASHKEACAEKLCQASGFRTGSFNSASGNMCEESYVSGWHRYYFVDYRIYFYGRVKKEALINATCFQTAAAMTTTTALPSGGSSEAPAPITTTIEADEENVVETSTFTMTTTSSAAPTTTLTMEPTATAAPTTTTSLPTTAAPTSSAEATGSATTTAAPSMATTTARQASSTITSAPHTTGATDVASTTPRAADGDIVGRLAMATADPAAFCGSAGAQSAVAEAVLAVAGATREEARISTSCAVASSRRRLAQLTGSVEVRYALSVVSADAPLRASIVVSLAAASHAELIAAINGKLAAAGEGHIVEVTEHAASLGVVVTTTTAPPVACQGLPSVRNSADVSACADLPHGATCEAACKPGHAMSAKISCEAGSFVVPGSCLPEGATPRVTRAIQLVLTLSGLFGGGDKDLAWAEENRGTVLAAVAASLGLPPGRLIIEFVMVKRSAGAGRRLLGEGRRAQESDEVMEVHVTVLVEDSEASDADLPDMAQRYQDRLVSGGGAGDASGASAPSLAAALTAELQTKGQPVPAGLSVAPTRPPTVVASFVAAVAEWLGVAWGPCSERCGAGRQEQRMECSLGEDLACEAELGQRPQEQRACEEHSECPFDVGCPFGYDSDLDCGAQLGVALGGLSAVTACCAAICIRRLIVTCRRHEGGTITLPEAGIKSKYAIYRPDEPTRKTSMTPRWLSAKSSAESLKSFGMGADGEGSVEDQANDGKTHVVWDTNVKELKQMFADRGTQLTFTAKVSEACAKTFSRSGLPKISSAAKLDMDEAPSTFAYAASRSDGAGAFARRSTGGDLRADDFAVAANDDELDHCLGEVAAFVDEFLDEGDDLADINPWTGQDEHEHRDLRLLGSNGREMRPLFADEERAEYYSCTMSKWLAATIRLAPNASANTIRYDAIITATKQRRVGVPVEDLRRPLHRADSVEVLSKRDGWIPAKISPQQPPHATNFGYMVEYPDDEGEAEEKIPATRVRRRFVEGERVKAYRGIFVGWVSGRVMATCDEPECEEPEEEGEEEEEEEEPAAEDEGAAEEAPGDDAASPRRGAQRQSTLGTTRSRCSSASLARSLPPAGGRRRTVCIDFEEPGSDKADSEWFPAFLVR